MKRDDRGLVRFAYLPRTLFGLLGPPLAAYIAVAAGDPLAFCGMPELPESDEAASSALPANYVEEVYNCASALLTVRFTFSGLRVSSHGNGD